MEPVTDFIFLGSKITADGDHSHEIKRCLLLGRKAMTPGELAYKIDHAPEADKKAYVPALYVNFDTKEFYAQDPNREGFERYAPQGWKSAYQDFRKLIPAEAKYWQE